MQLNPLRRSTKGELKHNPLYATFEHVVPKERGGKTRQDNIVLAHGSCNHHRKRRKFAHDPIYGEGEGGADQQQHSG